MSNTTIRRHLIPIGTLLAGSLLMSACGSSPDAGSGGEAPGSENATGEADAQQETLVLATGTQFPPMGFYHPDSGELVGFDIDLGEALGEQMGVEIEWLETEFSQFLTSVETGRSDAILGAMLDIPERQDTVTFVDYLSSGFQFFTSQENAQEITEIADFCGQAVAASRNSSYKASILEWSEANCEPGSPIEVLDTDGSPDARLQLQQGRVVGVMQTNESVSYLASTEGFVPIGEPITESFYGMGFAADNTEMRDAAHAALVELIENGTYEEILSDWELEGQDVETPTIDLSPVED